MPEVTRVLSTDPETQPSMIERVARAIETALSREMEDDKPGLIDGRAIARAAIAAMREPTQEMIAATLPNTSTEASPDAHKLAQEAVFLVEAKYQPTTPEYQVAGVKAAVELIRDYQSMIESALQEPEPPQ